MKKEKKLILIITIIILLSIITFLGIYIYNLTQKTKLIKEVNNIVKNKDLTIDTIDVNDIKTKGQYAKVEEAVKTYLNKSAIEIQKLIELMQEEKIAKLLSTENYQKDGPEFTETLSYIEDTKKQLNESIDKMKKVMDTEEIYRYIENYDVSNKYKQLYKEIMMNEDTSKDLSKAQTQLKDVIDTLIYDLDVAKDTINFLKEHETEWSIQSGVVIFNTQILVNQYNEMTSKLK